MVARLAYNPADLQEQHLSLLSRPLLQGGDGECAGLRFAKST